MKPFAVAIALFAALPALAGEIEIHDAYARTSGASAKSGAVFMKIVNSGTTADRLIAAETEAARRVELHTHRIDQATGVARMVELEDGIPVGPGAAHHLKRGGDHVMLMGLTAPLSHGDAVTLTLTFEDAGPMTLTIPVDLERRPDQGAHGHTHGENS